MAVQSQITRAFPGWVVRRPRLEERLRRGVQGPLTLVTGPPGAGKTVAVSSWAATGTWRPAALCWITCDDTTATVGRFCRALITSLRRAGIDLPVAPSGRRDGGDDEALSWELGEALSELAAPVIVVLDDFPARPGSAPAQVVTCLLRHARPVLRAVVLARGEPSLPLHRHRLAGELTEIRAGDLAFADHESAAVLARHGVRLAPAALRTLQERTGGWPAGIRLAAMAMAGRPDPDAVAARFSGDDDGVVGYLREEVVDAQPPGTRELLLATSVADRIDAGLAGGLAGEAGRAFPDLVRRNAFAVPLGHGWYRYPPMFGEALRTVLERESPGLAPVLHRRAAAWFERAGLLGEAVGQAARAGDWRYAARLVVDRLAIGGVLGLAPREHLDRAFDAMPREAVLGCAGPEPAIVAAAAAAARGDDPACAAALEHARAGLGPSSDGADPAARLCLAAVELCRPGLPAFAGAAGTFARVAALCREVPEPALDASPDLLALAHACGGRSHLWRGELREAARLFGEALAAAERAGGSAQSLECLGDLALTRALLGDVGRAAGLVARAGRRSGTPASPGSRGAVTLHLARAWVDLEQWRLDAARAELARAALAFPAPPDPLPAVVHALLAARTELGRGRPERALDDLRPAEMIVPRPAWLARRLALVSAEAHALRGESGPARAAAERAGGRGQLDAAVALARADLGDGAPDAAARLLRRSLRGPFEAPADARVEAWLLDAGLSFGLGDPSRGRRCLDRALRLAGREGIGRPFAMARGWLLPVLNRDPDLARQHRRLLEPLGLAPRNGGTPPPEPGPGPEPGAEPLPVERLSGRELDVLRLLAQMMTTEEIADRLCLSVNTVKTHLRNIYRKLAVTRRGAAVRRARQLSLLGPGSGAPARRSAS
ncbi:LuxR C-terminal-related transcriptional regulator [Actinomadura rugatobispora]|uniref:LuxR C-terminal-related transcriptional regulator n=1 Tax=Actinomadura rugatobispora TaxID=1994 RepID=A0ABW1AE87_9ACTN|nr:LuxR family transcriptional regulator [Actinomadura rugatobispora]